MPEFTRLGAGGEGRKGCIAYNVKIFIYILTGFGLNDTMLSQFKSFLWRCCIPLYLFEIFVSILYVLASFSIDEFVCHRCPNAVDFMKTFYMVLAFIRIPAIIFRFIKAIAYCCCHRVNSGATITNTTYAPTSPNPC